MTLDEINHALGGFLGEQFGFQTGLLDNGGGLVTQSKTITVQEPASDAWLQRTPGATEKPVTGQFFARDPTGYGKIYYNGTQSGAPAGVFLKVYTTDTGSDVL